MLFLDEFDDINTGKNIISLEKSMAMRGKHAVCYRYLFQCHRHFWKMTKETEINISNAHFTPDLFTDLGRYLGNDLPFIDRYICKSNNIEKQ